MKIISPRRSQKTDCRSAPTLEVTGAGKTRSFYVGAPAGRPPGRGGLGGGCTQPPDKQTNTSAAGQPNEQLSRPTALRPVLGRRRERVVGPGVFRVAAFEFLLHVVVGVFPETRQIGRDLLHAVIRSQEVQ